MTTPVVKPTTPASAPATTATSATPATTPAAKPANGTEATPAKSARLKLDEITAARKKLADDEARIAKTKAEVEPLVGKAKAFDEKLSKFAEDPAAFLKENGIDVNAVTEKLAADALASVRAATPDGRIDALQAELKELKEKDAKAKADANAAVFAKQVDDYKGTLVAGIKAETYPLTAKLATLEFGDSLRDYLWDVGRGVYLGKIKGLEKDAAEKIAAPTPDEILVVVEKRYADLAAGLVAPEVEEAETTKDVRTPEEIKADAEKRAKEKASAKPAPAKPTGAIQKLSSTLAERKAAARAKK